ncbi:LAMI_0C08020g1_1 [Lachancea mirantina]|uniref:histidinol-phosphate transaminase n=1 Tax=Lachancea mirantina TaxID=1230905 RepID=A0A1G4J4M2_9SACH|nr:LAMI_0C08020g1_1 [Lachancea mirantina]
MTFDLSNIVRPKILGLEPYRCARDDFTEGVLLDANENAFGPTLEKKDVDTQLHRYPDPHQIEFKTRMAKFRNAESAFKGQDITPLTADNLCLGVGSDESIDAVMRACCVPGRDKILILPPTYGMYSICAEINDVEVVKCPLVVKDNSFDVDTNQILHLLTDDPLIKLVFITSPGNPTGAYIEPTRLEKIASQWQNGFVVVDEAYIDFCSRGGSAAPLVNKFPNIVVLQTLSKSFGLAGVRLGVTFASKEMSRVLNAMKAPYNISHLASEVALEAMQPENLASMKKNAEVISSERRRVLAELTALDGVQDHQVGGLDANFIMVRVNSGDNKIAKELYYKLATESGVVTRFRGSEYGCDGCLRITIGTPQENDLLIKEFKNILQILLQ